jgi:hypothetical protein
MQGLKLKHSRVRFYYCLLVAYSYTIDVYDNFFICSYLRFKLACGLPYFNVVLGLITLYSFILVKAYFNKPVSYSIGLNDFFILVLFFNLYRMIWAFKNILYLLILAGNKVNFFVALNSKFFNDYWLINLLNQNYKWTPLFKKYSYFGYFRIHQNKSISQSNEDFIRMKC